MDHPHNATELGMFIRCINYYCKMWPSCAHILKPLRDHTVRCMNCTRRKAGSLFPLQAVQVTSELYCNGERNALYRCNP
ncbi:hypothetical protein ACHAW6_011078 [Cyclotella cf. meneghiniana]